MKKSLRVDPDSDQFFSGEDIQLSCESEWRVKRTRTGSDQVQGCGRRDGGFGSLDAADSTCFLYDLSSSDSGLYWCESAAGGRSPQRLLTVTDRNLILDSPALPVQTGSDITLRCRIRPGSGLSPVLLKDGAVVQNKSEWSFSVSKEHEGEYICKDTTEESEKRRLQVTDPPPTTAATTLSSTSLFPSPPSPSPPFWLMWVLRPLLVFSPYGVCTVLLVQVYRGSVAQDSFKAEGEVPAEHELFEVKQYEPNRCSGAATVTTHMGKKSSPDNTSMLDMNSVHDSGKEQTSLFA
ncbi:hypothetical protein WMY93_002445 [Mugilogobius chulae]|uniref:Immunoglobulin domain-containing protein n=1 Tax=Mugilogobius chulae TaxID=88201 RepID=A0AAW0Q4R3_9GOBI